MAKRPTLPSLYGVHPSVAYQRAIVAGFEKTTGRTFEEWVGLVRKRGPKTEKARRAWLQREHGLGGTKASMVAQRAGGRGLEGTDPEAYLVAATGYVEAMYSGRKGGLRPIHDRLVELALSLGEDIRICPCKTIVPVYRQHVIAEIKPATQSRIDFGLALGGARRRPPRRLIDTGGAARKDRITHRIPVTAVGQIDEQVARWLRIAYDLDA